MQIDHELIETLVLKQISGDISPSEAALLAEALANDAGSRELAENIRNKINSDELNSYLLANDKQLFTQVVIQKIQARKKRRERISWYISVSVAACLLVFMGIWYFSFNRGANTPDVTIDTQIATSRNIILSLPDGRKMQLDSTDQKLKAGGVTVNTRSRTLTYTVDSNASAVQYATLTVPPGKDYKIQLEDGTEIHLNAATRLRFPLFFKGNSREVTISGEAYLKVAHNIETPFIVHLPKGTVEVLGTEFNINTYDSTVERISLVAGALRFRNTSSVALLKPGMEGAATANDITISPFDAEEVLAWRKGMYYIDNATLAQLSAVVSRWYGCTMVVDTKEAASQRFTGVLYRNQSVEVMLRSIQLTNTIRYSTDEQGIIHIR